MAKTVAESTEHSAATAALCADEIVADVCLAKAQLALRVAVAEELIRQAKLDQAKS